jgi:hypothetical protein
MKENPAMMMHILMMDNIKMCFKEVVFHDVNNNKFREFSGSYGGKYEE